MPAASDDVTTLLRAWTDGDGEAPARLTALLYDELRRLAHAHLRHERPDHTLGTVGLVHEAYLRLLDVERVRWQDRAHFLAMASRTMRRVLVDYAHRRNAAKRGGGAHAEVLDEERLVPDAQLDAVIELDDALSRLEALHARAAGALAHHYFGGLTNEQSAESLGVSVATVERDLRFARAWLAREWKEG